MAWISDLFTKDVWLVVLGAVLALLTSFIIELSKGKIGEKRMRRLVRNLLKHEVYGRLNVATNEAQGVETLATPPYLSTPAGNAHIAKERQRLLSDFQNLLNAGRVILTNLDKK